MRIDAHSRVFRSALVTGATALLLAVGLEASSAVSSYTGQLTFGAPTITRTCAHGVPTQVKVSVPFSAAHLTAPVSRQFRAQFIYQGTTLGYLQAAAPVNVTLRPGERSPLVERFTVPTDRPYNVVALGLTDASGQAQSWERASLSCAAAPARLTAPTVTSVSHPCLASTTARLVNNSSLTWSLDPVVSGRTTTTDTIAPHTSSTVVIGRALQGAEHFRLSGKASASSSSATVALSDFAEACIRGYVHASLSAARVVSMTRLTAVERPVLPVGTAVDVYRVVSGKRDLVGRAHTTATGHATLTVPYARHATYLAVVTATHYSYATTTPTVSVP